MNNRKGRFKIGHIVIKNYPETVLKIMGQCIIIKAESMYAYDAIEYYALSKNFRKLKEGAPIPEYDVLVSNISEEPTFVEIVD
jgi:hypothetical protein